MFRPISHSREVESKGRIRPLPRPSRKLSSVSGPEHDKLTIQYYETLSKPRAEIFAKRPSSAAGCAEGFSVPIRAFDAPEVIRAATPFVFGEPDPSRPNTGAGRLPPMERGRSTQRIGSIGGTPSDPDHALPELVSANDDVDLSSFGVSGVARESLSRPSATAAPSSRPGTASGDKLVCFVGDRPLSYYSSPLRRGPGRLRSAGALALQMRHQLISHASNVCVPPISQNEIYEQKKRIASPHDTQMRLNQLLRCGSAASRHRSVSSNDL